MARDPLVEKLIAAARDDLADYNALLKICEREFLCLAGEELDDLPGIIEEKEALTGKIQEASDRNAPLWDRMNDWSGEDIVRNELGRMVEENRRAVEAIQGKEARIAEVLTQRSDEVRKAMGSLSRAGKAVGAYNPVRSYAPRFIDKKE